MINWMLKQPILLWHKVLAPLFPPACRFEPSCGAYALEALDRHPWWRALWLIGRRLARCNPFFEGGWDPVPPSQSPSGGQPPQDPRK